MCDIVYWPSRRDGNVKFEETLVYEGDDEQLLIADSPSIEWCDFCESLSDEEEGSRLVCGSMAAPSPLYPLASSLTTVLTQNTTLYRHDSSTRATRNSQQVNRDSLQTRLWRAVYPIGVAICRASIARTRASADVAHARACRRCGMRVSSYAGRPRRAQLKKSSEPFGMSWIASM